MKRLFRSSSMDDMSMKGLLSLAVLTGIAAGILVPLAMKAMGVISPEKAIMAQVSTGEDLNNFSTAAGNN